MIRSTVRSLFNLLGYDIARRTPANGAPAARSGLPSDFGPEETEAFGAVRPFTMTSPERIFVLYHAVQYIHRHRISGDVVECGVWKGGSMMAIARTLKKLGDESRHLHLFDTFEGMSEPTEKDVVHFGTDAKTMMQESQREQQDSVWCYSPIDEVKKNVGGTGYDPAKLHYIKGRVEDTIPANAPQTIALLRLDTDWYESTKHELVHLFPRLSPGGVLIIDDYGWWKGARQATDEYLEQNNIKILLNRIDHTGRVAVKLP
jgi:hypothetical protein